MRTDFECIYDWLAENVKVFPQLEAIGTQLRDKRLMLQPNGAAHMYEVSAAEYTDGMMKYHFKPAEPYYVDVDIICYRMVYEDDADRNLSQLAKVQAVCDWFLEQQNAANVPVLDKNECYMLECLTPEPFMRNYYEDGDTSRTLVDYAVTVRFYLANPAAEIFRVIQV